MAKVIALYGNGKTYTLTNVVSIGESKDKHGNKLIEIDRIRNVPLVQPDINQWPDYISGMLAMPVSVPCPETLIINATVGDLAYLVVTDSDKSVSVIPVTETISGKVLVDAIRLTV